jgi:DNA-binding PadR family transcriptional regulator
VSIEEARTRITALLGAISPLSGGGIHELTGIPCGSLYPALTRLEEAGEVTSEWEASDAHDDGTPRRRLYSIVR